MKQIDMQQIWVKFIFIKHYIYVEIAYHTDTVSEKKSLQKFCSMENIWLTSML